MSMNRERWMDAITPAEKEHGRNSTLGITRAGFIEKFIVHKV